MSAIKVKRLVVGMLETNCYIVSNAETKEGVCIDPGGSSSLIIKYLNDEKIKIQGIFLTHGHFDHINALEEVKKYTNSPVYISEEEKEVLLDPKINLSTQFGRNLSFTAEYYLKKNSMLTIANIEIQVLLTPGHTKGSACYYIEEENILFSGDTLFANSVGRTDLPTGNMEQLFDSVKQVLFLLPDETIVYPGHGDETKIAVEKRYNTIC